MFLTEEEIKNIIKSVSLDENVNVRENGITADDIFNGFTLYHRPKDANGIIGGKNMSIVDSLFKNGFSREFTNSNGGNMYGPGVYTVYRLSSSQSQARGYGKSIIKLKLLGGLKDFLIFSKQLASKTYGDKWRIEDQIRMLFSPKDANVIFSHLPHIQMHNDDDNVHSMVKTSVPAHEISILCRNGCVDGSRCRGYVYNGGHDGACCFIKDFQSVVPVAISYDNGRTWQNRLTQELIDRMNNEVDTVFQYGNMKDQYGKKIVVADKPINGFTVVWDSKENVNYIPVNSNDFISNVWFESGANWEKSPYGETYVDVTYNGNNIRIYYQNGNYEITDEDQGGMPLDISLEEIPEYFS